MGTEDDAVFNSIFGNGGGSEDDVVIDPVGLENENDETSKTSAKTDASEPYQYPYTANFDKDAEDIVVESDDAEIQLMDVEAPADAPNPPAAPAQPPNPPRPAERPAPPAAPSAPDEIDTTGMVIPITDIEKEQAAKDEMGSQNGPRIDPMLLRFMGIENRNDLQANMMDLDMDSLPHKPWRDSKADMTDWFNYGFTEDTWRAYCAIQVKMRMHLKRTTNSSEQLAQQQLQQVQSNMDKGRDRRAGVCFDFQNKGFCSRGDSCRWAHMEKADSHRQGGAPPGVCFDFQNKGHCSWGASCRWKHIDKSGVEHERVGGHRFGRNRSDSRSPSRDRRRGKPPADDNDESGVSAQIPGMLPGGGVPPHLRNLMMSNRGLLMPGVLPGIPGGAPGGPAIPGAANMGLAGINALPPGMRQMALQQMLAGNPNMQDLVAKANESRGGHDKDRHRHRKRESRKDGDRKKRRHDREDRKHRDRERTRDRKRRSRSRSHSRSRTRSRSRSRSRGKEERKKHKKTKSEKKSS